MKKRLLAVLLCMAMLLTGCGAAKEALGTEAAEAVADAENSQKQDSQAVQDTNDAEASQSAADGNVSGGQAAGTSDKKPQQSDTDKKNAQTRTPDEGTQNGRTSDAAADKAPDSRENGISGTKLNTVAEGLATPATSGRLQVVGARLCDQNGNPVQLRGLSTHGIGWFPGYVNSDLFAQFRNEWQANVIRLAMYTAEGAGYCTGGDQTYLKELIDTGVQAATDNDMYVVIDWHILSDSNPDTYKAQAAQFFAEMSEKYAGHNNVLYEICNEPNGGTSWETIKAYAEEIIPVIRSNDANAIIIVGTPTWSQDVDLAAKNPISGYSNIMYTLHFYAATHKDSLRRKMTKAIDAGLPVIVTEYGICDASGNGAIDYDSAAKWIDTLNEYGVSYMVWSICNKNETCSIFKSSCQKTKNITVEDLSESGAWQYAMLANGKGMMAVSEPLAEGQTGAQGGNAAQNSGQQGGASSSSSWQGGAQQNGASSGGDWQGGVAAPSEIPPKVIASGNLEITATVMSTWESGGSAFYQYVVSIKNNGSANVGDWSIDLTFSETPTLSDNWNGEYSVSGTTIHISGKDYNNSIPAGGEVKDIGFIVSGGTSLTIQ